MKRERTRTEAGARLGAGCDPGPGPHSQAHESAEDAPNALARLGRIVQRELTRRMAEAVDVGGEIPFLEQRA